MNVSLTSPRNRVASSRPGSSVNRTDDFSYKAGSPAFSLGFESGLQKVAFALLCLSLLIAPYLLSGYWPGDREFAPQGLWSGLAACIAFLLALAPRHILRPTLPTWLLGGFVGCCVLAAFTSVYLHDTLLEIARIATLLVWYLVARELLTLQSQDGEQAIEARRLVVLLCASLGMAVVCGLSVQEYRQSGYPLKAGTFLNTNLYANSCAMLLPFALAAIPASRKLNWSRAVSVVAVFVALVIAIGLVVSGSRGGFLAALVALLVFGAGWWRAQSESARKWLRQYRVAVSVATVVVLVVFGALAMKTVVPRLLNSGGGDNSTMFRVYTWHATLDMAGRRPLLGWGPGSYQYAQGQFAIVGVTKNAHQSWLQVAAEEGYPAMLSLLATCVAFLVSGWRMLKTDRWASALAGMCAVVAFGVHGLTDAGWGVISSTFALVVAFAFLNDTAESSDENAAAPTDGPRLRYGWVALALLMGCASWLTQQASAAEDARDASEASARAGATTRSLEEAKQATETDPYSSQAWQWLAMVYNANGDANEAEQAFGRATQLNPYAVGPWRAWANSRGETDGGTPPTRQLWDRAVQNAPRETGTRLARALWLIEKSDNDAVAWRDLQAIAAARNEPYGRFPALTDFDNLDFARASLRLAQRAMKRGERAEARALIAASLKELASAKSKLARQRELAAATDGAFSAPEDIDELEAQFKTLEKDAA